MNYRNSVLVIGDDGFISRHFVQLLADRSPNDRVVVIDSCSYSNDVVVFEPCKDLIDMVNLSKAYDFQYVINFSGSSSLYSQFKTGSARFLQVSPHDDVGDVVVKRSYCYGPYQHADDFLPQAIISVINEQPIIVSHEQAQHDMLYVADFCDALYKIMYFGDSAVYEVSSEFVVKERDIARMLLKMFQLPLSFIEYSDSGILITENMSNSKMFDLGWKPKVEFEDGLSRTVKWYKKNIRILTPR